MNRQELIQKLNDHNINADVYSLFGADYDERLVLDQKPFGKWAVYYCERGLRTGEKIFKSEDDACSFILTTLLNDPLAKK
jgi:hypothetical protein